MNQSINQWYTTHNVDSLRDIYIVPPRLAPGKRRKSGTDFRAFSLELYLHIDKVPSFERRMLYLLALKTSHVDQEAGGKPRRAGQRPPEARQQA